MASFGDILYILFIGAIFFSQFFVKANKKNQKKQKKRKSTAPTPTFNPLETWEQKVEEELREAQIERERVEQEAEDDKVINVFEQIRQEQEEDTPLSYETTNNYEKLRLKNHFSNKKRNFFNKIKESEISRRNSIASELKFNNLKEVRKAVLYNEILKRKYS